MYNIRQASPRNTKELTLKISPTKIQAKKAPDTDSYEKPIARKKGRKFDQVENNILSHTGRKLLTQNVVQEPEH